MNSNFYAAQILPGPVVTGPGCAPRMILSAASVVRNFACEEPFPVVRSFSEFLREWMNERSMGVPFPRIVRSLPDGVHHLF